MKTYLLVVCLYMCINGGRSSGVYEEQDIMLLAGPLTQQGVRTSSSENEAFDCSHPLPPLSKQYFKYLQSKGVTHFKVPLSWAQLLPTGHPSEAKQAVVRCYRTLLKQLLEVGLQPLVVIHGSTVPDSLRSRYGGWQSWGLVERFQQYAEFAFKEFAPLARSWVTFSNLDGVFREVQATDANRVLQTIIQLTENIYQFYHQNFPDKGELD